MSNIKQVKRLLTFKKARGKKKQLSSYKFCPMGTMLEPVEALLMHHFDYFNFNFIKF